MTLLYLKALHIVFAVSWFAGLFYIVRLFIYQTEAEDQAEEIAGILRKQYQLMQKRLWYIITWPAAVLTLVFGLAMLFANPIYLKLPWVYMKLSLVILLFAYHLWCGKIFRKLQSGRTSYSSGKLRLINEIATLLLFALVFVAVLKSAFQWIPALLGFIALALLLMMGIRFYKKQRGRKDS